VVRRENHASVSTIKTKTLDPHNPKSLNFTKISEAWIERTRADNWNSLLGGAIKLALQNDISVRELQKMSIPVKEGHLNKDGYCPLTGTEVSFQNVAANRAWSLTFAIAQRLKVEIMVKFMWRDKEEAAYPGEEGLLHWKP